MSDAPRPVLSLKRQEPEGAGVLLAALEHAWRAIAEHHPDLPPAQIITGQGSGQRGGLLLGHLAPDRWEPADGRGGLRHELLIAGEGLARGAVDVFTTELHEAAHALALAREIPDTSRDGRYHNKHYQRPRRGARPRRRARPAERLERNDADRRDPGALPAGHRRARPRNHPPPPTRARRRERPQPARRDVRLPATDPRRPTSPRRRRDHLRHLPPAVHQAHPRRGGPERHSAGRAGRA